LINSKDYIYIYKWAMIFQSDYWYKQFLWWC